MSEQDMRMQAGQATIMIETRKYRIRVHKKSLHLLGDPEYIELLVNPEKREIAIRECSPEAPMGHKVCWNRMTDKRCYEIYSKDFVLTIYEAFQIPKDEMSFHLNGYMVPKEKLLVFPLSEIETETSLRMEEIHEKK